MIASFLPEPELEFGHTGRHIDIRYGLMQFGPLDAGTDRAPQQIRLGIVGTANTLEGLAKWLAKCEGGLPAKQGKYPDLFPRFPGFGSASPFASELVIAARLSRVISGREISRLTAAAPGKALVDDAVDLMVSEAKHLAETSKPDVVIYAPPAELMAKLDESVAGWFLARKHRRWHPENEEEKPADEVPPAQFHDVLKARSMSFGVPVQMVRPETYDPTQRRSQKRRPERQKATQDEATRAWNFHTALYYKAGGTPWRLLQAPSDLTTCYVGVSFYKAAEGDRLLTSMAQVFNELGDGVIVRGGPALLDKDDRLPHMRRDDADKLLRDAMAAYRREHRTLPARVVVHKTSSFNRAELDGFQAAADSQQLEVLELLALRKSGIRLLRSGTYPPLRGTLLELDTNVALLYTKGSVDFFKVYPGMYVPRALEFRAAATENPLSFLAAEILALSKMNWNNTQFDGGEPITTRAARQVADILRHVPEGSEPLARYGFYM
jgi:hypothetical protein